ncbi:histidine kinase [Butyricicoccus faecihominis]|uniref:sensor histidine kinase n=1 Tax=Butyricicoccus faecihominis TaxID=1712515 RepID=UPI002479271A|nr:histidine kinase [Butyricicoccus faecihominis]MCQ5130157.1 histidine kinase [Butyricicoccus faecihominis]
MKYTKKAQSIRRQLHSAYLFIVSLLAVPTILLLVFLLPMTARYHQHIGYIADARDIVGLSGSQLETELWNIVAGNQAYETGGQRRIMEEISRRLDHLLYETETYESRQQVRAAMQLVETLNTYIGQLGAPPYRHSSMYSNEQTLREIRSVSGLLGTVLQEYIYIEIGVIADINQSLRASAVVITLLAALLLLIIVVLSVDSCRSVQQDIREPISCLETMAVQLAAGHLDARAAPPAVSELSTLTQSLNTMADQLDELIDSRIADQRNLRKAEMRTLQAQITPHFIYNTLDTIVWLAQQKENEAVVDLTMALTQFFRISLSGGGDFITVGKEVMHVESYLQIQSVRYGNIMQYKIDIDEALREYHILKLLLQPLVENAIYHGIKKKRSRGCISVSAKLNPDRTMTFTVSDTGIGMTEAQLKSLRGALQSENAPRSGFGLYNVNQRIRMYYDTPGLTIESVYKSGTMVSFTIPSHLA